jgi:hypothetical protein
MRDSSEVIILLERQKALQKLYAASGSAPAHVFSKAGLSPPLSTCYPIVRLRNRLAKATHDDVVVYNNVITSQGPGSSLLFAVELGELLYDDANKANMMARKLLVDRTGKLNFRRAVKQGSKRRVEPATLGAAIDDTVSTEHQPQPTKGAIMSLRLPNSFASDKNAMGPVLERPTNAQFRLNTRSQERYLLQVTILRSRRMMKMNQHQRERRGCALISHPYKVEFGSPLKR